MSKKHAKSVIYKFTKRLKTAVEYHRELLLAVHPKKHQASLETMLAEQFVFNIAVLWEVFLNELLLSYIVVSPARFSKSLKDRIIQSSKVRFGSEASQMIKFDFPKKLTISKAASLADPNDFNITAESADKLRERANDFLVARYARLFTLDTEDAQLVDFVVVIRNYLAHRSGGAHTRLKKAVALLSGSNANLHGSVSNVGTYLKTRDANGDPRSVFVAERLIDLANKLT